MNRRTIHFLHTLGKLGFVGAGVAASIYATVATVKAATGEPYISGVTEDDIRINLPGADFPPFRKWNYNWDRLEPGLKGGIWPSNSEEKDGEKLESGQACLCEDHDANNVSVARRNLILVRHGQYNVDPEEDDCKQFLTQLGEEQAALIGKRLAKMNVKFTSITSSSMTRAIQTAEIILKNMNQKDLKLKIKDPLLREGPPCVPEPPYRKPELWNPNQRDVLVEGARIEAGFRKYFHRAEPSQREDSYEIIVCHGNVIRYFSCRALQFPPEGWIRISIDHCSITRFTILPTGEVVLRGLGDCGHIPAEKASVI